MWNFNFMIALSLCEGYHSILRAIFMSGKQTTKEKQKSKRKREAFSKYSYIPQTQGRRKQISLLTAVKIPVYFSAIIIE